MAAGLESFTTLVEHFEVYGDRGNASYVALSQLQVRRTLQYTLATRVIDAFLRSFGLRDTLTVTFHGATLPGSTLGLCQYCCWDASKHHIFDGA